MHIWKVTKHASFEANFLLWSRVSTLPLWFIFLTSKQKSLQASLLQTRVAAHNWFLPNSSTNGSLSKINTCTFVDLCTTTVSLGWILVDAHTCCFVAACSRADCGRLLVCACLSRVKRGRPLWEWLHNGYVTFSSFTPIIMRLKSMKVVFCNTRLTFENTHQELPVSTAQLWSSTFDTFDVSHLLGDSTDSYLSLLWLVFRVRPAENLAPILHLQRWRVLYI